jgi:hypothetical protein
MSGTMEGNDTITLAANSVTAQDGTTGPAVAAVGTCAANTVKPSVVSATGVMTHTGSATCTSADLAEDFIYTFSKTGIGAGILGDAFTIKLVNSASGTTAVTTSYNSLTKTAIVNWNDTGTAAEASITAIVAAINADATLGANGTAVVADSSNGKTMATGADINCAAGTTTVTVTATMNAAFQPHGDDIVHTGVTLVNGTVSLAMAAEGVVTGTWNANAYAKTFKHTFPLTAATQVLVKGTSTIAFAINAITSLNDVVNSAKSTAVIN